VGYGQRRENDPYPKSLLEVIVPIYEYKCGRCRKVTELICNVNACQDRIKCSCGKTAKKILNRSGAVHTDGDVKWLESARMTLQPDKEKPITTRGEWKRYLKNHQLECIG
jgi:putative FmdB family regulatory protein